MIVQTRIALKGFSNLCFNQNAKIFHYTPKNGVRFSKNCETIPSMYEQLRKRDQETLSKHESNLFTHFVRVNMLQGTFYKVFKNSAKFSMQVILNAFCIILQNFTRIL